MQTIGSIAVVGAGTMGSAIAQHFAMKGKNVQVADQNSDALGRGRDLIQGSLSEAVERKILSPEESGGVLARLSLSTDLECIRGCDLVIEAVFEDKAVKRELFKKLESIVAENTILATNTSSFLVSEIAQGLKRPERVVGLHYFYHAAKNKLVEIVCERAELGNLLYSFFESIDKIPILIKDSPGFVVNRFFVPWLNESVKLLEEGFGGVQWIDDVVARAFGIGMGPFALMNATGVRIADHAARGLASYLGESYFPAKALTVQAQSGKNWDIGGQGYEKSQSESVIRERLFSTVFRIAEEIVKEEVTDASSVDLGARVGLNWPKGPFELMRLHGGAGSVRKYSWVRTRSEGTNSVIEFNIPDRMNPLGEEVVTDLESAWKNCEKNESRMIFIKGRGKAFVAGADIKFFLDCMERKDFARIVFFTRRTQELLKMIATSKISTVAYLDGLALGGGLELALSCRRRIGTSRTRIGFPETGIGIFPGLGGTVRTTRLVGRGLSKYMVATGAILDAEQALDFGLIDTIAPPDLSLDELSRIELNPKTKPPKDSVLAMAKRFENFDGSDVSALEPKERSMVGKKAPLALRIAMDLIDSGERCSLDEALQRELSRVLDVFFTQDASIGLQSVLLKSKPVFTGR
jgi:enoyl-CoA hydratase/3-hydroxyacyl-CoA dehydrogenase